MGIKSHLSLATSACHRLSIRLILLPFCSQRRRLSDKPSSIINDGSHQDKGIEAAREGEAVRVDAVAGTPPQLTQRRVYIYQAARNAMQSGLLHQQSEGWRIDFENTQARWENPLMGWTSSRDPVQAIVLRFDDRESAIRFAERQGWDYSVREPNKALPKKKSYAENFLYSASKLKLIRPK